MSQAKRSSTARSFSTVNNKGYTISESTAYTTTNEKTGQQAPQQAQQDTPDFAPWTMSSQQVVAQLETNAESGLSDQVAGKLHSQHGDNLLDSGGGVSLVAIFISQTANAMVLVLLVCMVISLAIKDWITGGVIGAVAVINIVVGFFQELSAAKTMDSLRSLSSPTAHVIRGGSDETIPAKDLVPGDLVNLKAGDTVPADCRLVQGINFETEEALLTGESMPVVKDYDAIIELNGSVGDRVNMAFASSTVSKGRATAIVTSIGMSTEIGRIAQSLKGNDKKYRAPKRDEQGNSRKRDYAAAGVLTVHDWIGSFLGLNEGTPLHRLMARLAVGLFGFAVLVAIVVMAAQKFHVDREVAVYAIVVAISMIPASMVVVLTITMAMGTKAMAQRHVMIRKLDSLEALGSVSDICSDKTGTLTQGKMIVRKAWIPDYGELDVQSDSNPFDPTKGSVSLGSTPVTQVEQNTTMSEFMFTASLANVSNVVNVDNEWKVNGDPTEVAVQVFVTRLSFDRSKWCSLDHPEDLKFAHLAEYPFDSTIKRMSAVVKENESGNVKVFTKGAVERILPLCSSWYCNGLQGFSEADHKTVFDKVDALSAKGLRVLAFAQKTIKNSETDFAKADRATVETELTFMGLVGIYDPPRAESAPAVATAHRAGIEVHMLTGDHIGTATAIAKEVGILGTNYTPSQVMTATEFDAMSDAQIDALPAVPLVIARCAPQTKVRVIDALHRRSAFTAMTGDGVNDSPSLRKADVGIAMGIAGSDVAKDSSDIVLSDDNFASILNAVEEGRRMTANIQKFVLHLLAGNVASVLFLLIGLAYKDNSDTSVFPMAPVEALWIIMATSSFPAMGLGFEEAEPGIMEKNPSDPKSAIFTWEVIIDMIVYGFLLAVICTVSFASLIYGYYDGSSSLGHLCNEHYSEACEPVFRTRSLTFAQMTWGLLVLAWEMMHMRRSMFLLHPGSDNQFKQFFKDLYRNKILFWSITLAFLSVFPVVYIPVINTDVFKHSPPTWEWAVAFGGLAAYVLFIELWKYAKRCYYRGEDKARDLV